MLSSRHVAFYSADLVLVCVLRSLGIFYPYFALYLRENAGLTGTEVGLILAISPFIGMLTQPSGTSGGPHRST